MDECEHGVYLSSWCDTCDYLLMQRLEGDDQ